MDNYVYENMLVYRKRLSQIPEIAFKEHNTSRYISSKLRDFGLNVVENIGGTGVVGIIHGTSDGLNVAIRADMDALLINGKCKHACGHDGHMAIVLGIAQYCSTLKNTRICLFYFHRQKKKAVVVNTCY